jgi:hypothetical protein
MSAWNIVTNQRYQHVQNANRLLQDCYNKISMNYEYLKIVFSKTNVTLKQGDSAFLEGAA